MIVSTGSEVYLAIAAADKLPFPVFILDIIYIYIYKLPFPVFILDIIYIYIYSSYENLCWKNNIDIYSFLKRLTLKVRVVSMPCCELFNRQSVAYRRSVITPGVCTVSFEALSTLGWERYSHFQIGMTTFGASAPYEVN